MLEILLPDGTIVSHPEDATPLSVAEKIGSRLAKAVIAAKIGDLIVDATPKDTEKVPHCFKTSLLPSCHACFSC